MAVFAQCEEFDIVGQNEINSQEKKILWQNYLENSRSVTLRNKLAECYIGLVDWIVRNWQVDDNLSQDLIQEGRIYLLYAIEKYDPSKKIKFTAWASCCIRNGILKYLDNAIKEIRIPSYLINKTRRYRQFVSEFIQKYHRLPTAEEIIDLAGIGWREYRNIQLAEQVNQIVSLDAPINPETTSPDSLMDTFPGENGDTAFVEKTFWSIIEDLINELPERERQILKLRLDGFTLAELGQYFQVSRGRIDEICRKARKRLTNLASNLIA